MAVNPPTSLYMDGNMARREPSWPSHFPIGREQPFGSLNPFESNLMEGAKKVRPSHFQKAIKSYDGSSDPRDHLAKVRQFSRPKQVQDLHTMIEGFGLTLEGKALEWF